MPQSLNERIGDVVKRKRQKHRYTQADLGARIGVSGSYISSIESGQTSPRVAELEALAVQFHTTFIELITEAAGREEYNFSSATRERDAFMTLFDGLAPENQKMARSFLLFLRQQQDQEPTP